MQEKISNLDASVLGSNEGNLRKIWRKLEEILEMNYGNSVTNLGIFEENLSKRYWEDFETTGNSKRNLKNFEEIFRTFGRTFVEI